MTTTNPPCDPIGNTLRLLLNDDGEFHIDRDVYDHALRVAHTLQGLGMSLPKIWNHGPRSVVFDWEKFKLTITPNKIFGLLSQ